MPKVSIIVPVYKAEKYLRSCVDSILAQTFYDFDVYLVNDGSPDKCGAICEEYAARDRRIHVLHQDNQGQAAARNHALALTHAPWICFVDSDDMIHPQMLQRLWEGAQIGGVGISMCSMVEAPEVPVAFYAQPSGKYEVLEMTESVLANLYDQQQYPGWVACAKLIRREYITKHLFCEGRVYEDNEAVCHWLYETPTLVRIPDAMYYYRTNPDSTTQQRFSEKKLDYLWALEQIIRFYDSIGYKTMKERFVDCYVHALADCMDGARYHMVRMDIFRQIKKRGRHFVHQEGIALTLEQKERLLNATHPELIKRYWPVKGFVVTFRNDGISGVLRKIVAIRKGEGT